VRFPRLEQLTDPERVSGGWAHVPPDWVALTPGEMVGTVTLPQDGTYSLWLRGSIGRPVRVLVDGRQVARIRWEEAYPGNYIRLGLRDLRRGPHRVEVIRGGGASLLPGVGNEIGSGNTTSLIGPVAFRLDEDLQMQTVPADRAGAVCRGDELLDWMEVVRP
jgi:hypothetical protein